MLIGVSSAIRNVRTLVRTIGPLPAPVLIQGETGTGKELVARALHEASPRRNRRLVVVNCAAVADSLLEAELFGHSRGSFTGAVRDRAGLVESAHQGTLFLDEVATMSQALQSKLLRTLESGEIRRVGENVDRRVNVRVIAATNVDLADPNVEFRRDLFYRLNAFSIVIQPLRSRKDDIQPLVQYFLHNTSIHRVSQDAHATLLAYDYPGNVRELKHALEYAAAFSECGTLERVHLPAVFQEYEDHGQLLRALKRHHWQIRQVASEMAVSRTTVWRRMRRYGIRR